MLLPLGIKFIPEEESEHESEEEPEFIECQFERQVSEKKSQPPIYNNMTPDVELGQGVQSSNIEHEETS